MANSNDPQRTRGWDTYWQGVSQAEAYSSGGVSHPAVVAFWDESLGDWFGSREQARVIDIATGSGAVVERLAHSTGQRSCEVTCIDIAAAAVESVCRRVPSVTGIVADARSIPLPSGSFDLAVSQFGIEYAGKEAFDEAARLLADEGTLLLLMHIRPGLIFDECAAAHDAVERTARCGFVPRALALFEAGFAAVRGADRAPYERAASELNPAIAELESVMSDHGEHVAGDTIARLYADTQRIHSSIQHYDPDEVLGWLRNMQRELAEYGQRMASMCEAALGEEQFEHLCDRLRKRGFEISRGEPLLPAPGSQPLAWILSATRQGPATAGARRSNEAGTTTRSDEAVAWARKELGDVVWSVTDRGLVDYEMVEARVAWHKPFDVVIGQCRDQAGLHPDMFWLIGGSVPVDCIHTSLAASARDAGRYFAMKWQLEAARYENPATRGEVEGVEGVDWEAHARQLIDRAEYLYAVVDDDRLWSAG